MNPDRRTALVTGGSSGIGRGVAETLARDGCDVGVIYLGSAEDARPVVDRIRSFDRRAWARVCNVADAAEVNGTIDALATEFGTIDILVNCAGIFRDQVSWKMSDEQWHDVIDVDLSGPFNCARAVIPVMRKADRGGSIVNISSINGLRGKFGQSNYASAKAGLIGLTKTLARELAMFNITVNAVAPGMIQTPILEAIPPDALEASIQEILLGRIGQVEDVAELVAFLCSDRARFITGEVIRVDGGQYI